MSGIPSPTEINSFFDEFLAVAKDERDWIDVNEKLGVKVTQVDDFFVWAQWIENHR